MVMEEVRPNNLIVGQDYYIQMVGRYKTDRRQSGKAIGRGFIRTITFGEIIEQDGRGAIDCGIHPDCFEFTDIFVQFSKVEPVNGPDGRVCGICDYQFYPATLPSFDTLNNEQKNQSCGGYKFFKMNKKELIKRVATQAMDKCRPGIAGSGSDGSLPLALQKIVKSYMGGKKRRRKSRRKTRRKTRKIKRKSRKRRRKRKSKKRR